MYVVDNKSTYTVARHSGVKTVVVKYVAHFLIRNFENLCKIYFIAV